MDLYLLYSLKVVIKHWANITFYLDIRNFQQSRRYVLCPSFARNNDRWFSAVVETGPVKLRTRRWKIGVWFQIDSNVSGIFTHAGFLYIRLMYGSLNWPHSAWSFTYIPFIRYFGDVPAALPFFFFSRTCTDLILSCFRLVTSPFR